MKFLTKFLFVLLSLTSFCQTKSDFTGLPLQEYLFGMLHTFAAAYPDVPTEEDSKNMLDMLQNLGNFLPESDIKKNLIASFNEIGKDGKHPTKGRDFLIPFILDMRNKFAREGIISIGEKPLAEVSEYWGKNCDECSVKK